MTAIMIVETMQQQKQLTQNNYAFSTNERDILGDLPKYVDNRSALLPNDLNCSPDEVTFQIYRILVPSLFAAMVLIGLLGNGLVIYVILSREKLRTITNLLLLNLAISDVAFLLICGSFTVVHYVLTEWPFGSALCRIIQYLLYVSCYVTVYTLVAVSVVRYVSVVHGKNSFLVRHKKNAIVMILVIWVVFLLAKTPILLVHGVSFNEETKRVECIVSGKVEGQKLFASFFIFAYAVPLSIIGTLYLLIVKYLKSQNNAHAQAISQEERQSHVTKVLAVVVLTFAVCWLPLHLHLLAAYYGSIPNSVAYKILLIVWHALVYANSMLNPINYHIFSKDFRESFKQVICRKRVPPPPPASV